MPHINFLEKKAWDLKHFELNYFFMLVLPATLLLLFSLFGAVQKWRIGRLETELTALRAEVQDLSQKTGQEPEDVAVSSGLVDPLAERVAWAGLLNEVAWRATSAIKLESLRGSARGREFVIEGWSIDLGSVDRFKGRLKEMTSFSDVMLVSSKADEEKGRVRQRFELMCRLKGR